MVAAFNLLNLGLGSKLLVLFLFDCSTEPHMQGIALHILLSLVESVDYMHDLLCRPLTKSLGLPLQVKRLEDYHSR